MTPELRYYKSRITRAAHNLESVRTKANRLNVNFTFPQNKEAAITYIREQRAGIQQALILLRSSMKHVAPLITQTEEVIRDSDPTRMEALQTEFITYLEDEALSLIEQAHTTEAELDFRLFELQEQERIINEAEVLCARPAHHSSNASLSSFKSTTAVESLKLPQLTIPYFDGNIREFTSFWTTFDSMIDSKEDLESVNKFLFLKQALKGDALNLIAPLPVIGENYEKAVTLLKGKYDRKSCMTDLIISDIQNIPPANNSTPSCRHTLDLLKANVLLLECEKVALGDNPLWRNTILSKFPHYLTRKVIIAEKQTDSAFTVEEILDEIEATIALNESVELTTSSFEPSHEHSYIVHENEEDHESTEE